MKRRTTESPHVCLRVEPAFRRRFSALAKRRMKTVSELAREALLDYVERREREVAA